MEARPLHETIAQHYSDRGGWKQVEEIFNNKMEGEESKYEARLKLVQDQYRVSRGTAVRWHVYYRKLHGLRK